MRGQKIEDASMSFDVENYIASLPREKQAFLREQMKHSFTFYGLDGEEMGKPPGGEDLLAVLDKMRCFVVDTNSSWKCEAAKPENFDKAFILGETLIEEPDNLKGIFFNAKTDITNNNLFRFGQTEIGECHFYELARLDAQHHLIYDERGLELESMPRKNRTDTGFLAREKELKRKRECLKEFILTTLKLTNVKTLPSPAVVLSIQASLLPVIREKAPHCFRNFANSSQVATFCYAMLLLESGDIGSKTRREFNDSNNRNVFGDTRLVQNALWLNAHILSNDKAVRKMVGYLNLPGITVSGRIKNSWFHILWYRFLKSIKQLTLKSRKALLF